MYDVQAFKESQLPLQRKALEHATALAGTNANPVIEVEFMLYPEVIEELEEKGWIASDPYRIVHNGRIKYITHIYPKSIYKSEENKKQAKALPDNVIV